MPIIAEVILPVYLQNTFHYSVNEKDLDFLQCGCRVLVPFGKSNKLYIGIVLNLFNSEENDYHLKNIHQIIDYLPIFQKYHLKFWKWVADYYCCSLGEVMLLATPNHLILHTQTLVHFTDEIHSLDYHSLTEKEKSFIDFLSNNNPYPYEKLTQSFSEYIIKKLLKKQIIQLQTILVNPYKQKLKTFVFLNKEELRLQFSSQSSLTDSEILSLAIQKTKSENQQKVLLYLIQNDGIEKNYLLHHLQINESVIKSLEKKKWIRLEKHAVERVQLRRSFHSQFPLENEEWKFCNQVIHKIKNQEEWKPCLFFHDLGNRRIAFYIEWFKSLLQENQQVLFLVPEIAFTDKFVMELQNHFQESLGIYHSRINDNERVEICYKVLLNEYKIIIGVRSALFLPFSSLGLILIDEEQDPNYKQEEKNPKINIKDAGIYYAKTLQIPVILASQTPSLETYYQTQVGKYHLINYKKNPLPKENQIQILDIKSQTQLQQTIGIFAEESYQAIYKQKKKKQISVLFINRKGYAPKIVCNACGHVHFCPSCDIPLTYHKHINRLKCHYCGYQEDNIYFCKHCGSNDLTYEGFGTEKIEEQLHTIFPNFTIERLDSEKFKTPKQLSDFLQSIQKNQLDILIGTQLITKILHLKNIELFIVLLADMMIHIPNFRAFEYSYQFLRQIINDFDIPNQPHKQIIIQTRIPNHKLFGYLFKDYATYYHDQLLLREELNYPPFTRLIEIELLHTNQNILNASIGNFDKLLKNAYSDYILGPSIPSIAKLKNHYRINYLLKIPKNQNTAKIKLHIQKAFKDFVQIEKDRNFRLMINVDPK